MGLVGGEVVPSHPCTGSTYFHHPFLPTHPRGALLTQSFWLYDNFSLLLNELPYSLINPGDGCTV